MEELWCWRCQMEIPMLDEEEFGLVMEAYNRTTQVRRRAERVIDPRPVFSDWSVPQPRVDPGRARWAVKQGEQAGMEVVERERKRRGIDPAPPLDSESVQLPGFFRPALEMYRLLTGFEETHFAALYHHRIALHGPDCPECEKPLRTPRAGYCLECGYGMEEYSEDSRSLVVRKGLE